MLIATIADVHGNAPALEAVLDDLRRARPDRVVQLGDAFNGPIDPAGVVRLLRSMPMLHVRGNGERMVLESDPAGRTRSATFARERLNDADLGWIAQWPQVAAEEAFTACHGSPSSDVEYLLESLVPGGVGLKEPTEVAARLQDVTTPVLFCGHTHVPRVVRAREDLLVINPGSVGLPAYQDDAPIPHRMEAGSPEARYALVEVSGKTVRVSQIAVPYDYEAAARAAESEGFRDWARALRTGYAG